MTTTLLQFLFWGVFALAVWRYRRRPTDGGTLPPHPSDQMQVDHGSDPLSEDAGVVNGVVGRHGAYGDGLFHLTDD